MKTLDVSKPTEKKLASLAESFEILSVASFSPALHNAAKIQKELLKRGADGHFLGGIVHETLRGANGRVIGNVVHIANPYQKEPLDVVTLPTRCSKQEIERIRSKIIPMQETYEILLDLAKAYEQRNPILIEGDTSIGKTFIVNRFMELLYGPGSRPIDFYCSGQTDVSELLGKWAPKTSGLSDRERKLLDDFLQSEYGKKKLLSIQDELVDAKDLPQQSRQSLLQGKLSNLLESVGLQRSVQWEFSYGAIPKAMMCNVEPGGKIVLSSNGGTGTILKIDEVGLAEPAVTMALLRIRGEAGKPSESIQLWEAGGELVPAGPDFFVVYTTNPSDKDYVQRKEIDPALARSVIWSRKESLSKESLALAAQKYLSFSIGNDPGARPLRCVIDLRKESEIAAQLAEVAAIVHGRYLELLKNGESGRKQKLPGSLDHLARLSSYLLSKQVVDPDTGIVDFSETLKRAVHFVYLNGLLDKKKVETISKELEMLLTSDTVGIKKFRNSDKKRHDILQILSQEADARRPAPPVTKPAANDDVLSQDRQMYFDLSDSLLAQLEEMSLSLERDILPQIETALSMLSDPHVQRDLVTEFIDQEKPKSRTESEWSTFKEALFKLSARFSEQHGQEQAA